MCRVLSRELGHTAAAVGEARLVVAHALARWDLAALVPDAELLVSELATNAVLHARTDVALTVAVADGTLEVGITDRSAEVPLPRRGEDPSSMTGRSRAAVDWWAEGGRGLKLVDLISDEWGVATLTGGKQVWFRLAVHGEWPHRSDCPCGGDELDRVRLESGRYAAARPGPWDRD